MTLSVGLILLFPPPLIGFIVINYLPVLPAYQRLGLGRRLLDIGLDEADKLGASAFLVATEMGAGLYRKAEFREIESFSIDLRPWGGEGENSMEKYEERTGKETIGVEEVGLADKHSANLGDRPNFRYQS